MTVWFSVQISESKAADGLYVDVGTQTHLFRSAPFTGRTSLADVMADRPLKLRLQLQTERVNSRHNRASSVFTFLCGHTFHRREFATHFRCPRSTPPRRSHGRRVLVVALTAISSAGTSTTTSRRL